MGGRCVAAVGGGRAVGGVMGWIEMMDGCVDMVAVVSGGGPEGVWWLSVLSEAVRWWRRNGDDGYVGVVIWRPEVSPEMGDVTEKIGQKRWGAEKFNREECVFRNDSQFDVEETFHYGRRSTYRKNERKIMMISFTIIDRCNRRKHSNTHLMLGKSFSLASELLELGFHLLWQSSDLVKIPSQCRYQVVAAVGGLLGGCDGVARDDGDGRGYGGRAGRQEAWACGGSAAADRMLLVKCCGAMRMVMMVMLVS
ncbi:hypothetical protein Tco_0903646 [Tanacetum coccineum]